MASTRLERARQRNEELILERFHAKSQRRQGVEKLLEKFLVFSSFKDLKLEGVHTEAQRHRGTEGTEN
jgi:hypothetical protein